MGRTDDAMEGPAGFAAGRTLWRRCRSIETSEDEVERFLDLAALADGQLDGEEHDRVAARVASDPAAAADVAAARVVSAGGIALPGGIEPVIQRAVAIVADAPENVQIIRLARQSLARRILESAAQWGGLAAAIVVASWLGFAMGSGASLSLNQPGQVTQISNENFLPELLDPPTGFIRYLGEGQQT
jgi:anti-sigma factor RsiW